MLFSAPPFSSPGTPMTWMLDFFVIEPQVLLSACFLCSDWVISILSSSSWFLSFFSSSDFPGSWYKSVVFYRVLDVWFYVAGLWILSKSSVLKAGFFWHRHTGGWSGDMYTASSLLPVGGEGPGSPLGLFWHPGRGRGTSLWLPTEE